MANAIFIYLHSVGPFLTASRQRCARFCIQIGFIVPDLPANKSSAKQFATISFIGNQSSIHYWKLVNSHEFVHALNTFAFRRRTFLSFLKANADEIYSNLLEINWKLFKLDSERWCRLLACVLIPESSQFSICFLWNLVKVAKQYWVHYYWDDFCRISANDSIELWKWCLHISTPIDWYIKCISSLSAPLSASHTVLIYIWIYRMWQFSTPPKSQPQHLLPSIRPITWIVIGFLTASH